MRAVGLEPTLLPEQEPKSCASASSATPASATTLSAATHGDHGGIGPDTSADGDGTVRHQAPATGPSDHVAIAVHDLEAAVAELDKKIDGLAVGPGWGHPQGALPLLARIVKKLGA